VATAPVFPNYLQMRERLPLWVWQVLRVVGVGAALSVCALLFLRPESGLFVFWGLFVPTLPLLFLLAPGLWRNVCPMASLNQMPRLLGRSRGLVLPDRLKEYGYVVGIGLFLAVVSTRRILFNESGPALGLLLLVMLAAALAGGLLFKGKSGWCGSMCPLLPVQRVYGQSPFLTVRNSHCRPCVGCTKNCYDFNPAVAYLSDLYDQDRNYGAYRKFFVSAFPGVVLAFYTQPGPPVQSALELYLQFGLYVCVSAGSFFALESFLKVTTNRLTALYGAAALNLYYWFNFPVLAASIGGLVGQPVPDWAIWGARLALLAVSAAWVARTYAKEPVFLSHALASTSARIPAHRLAAHRVATAGKPEVTLMPDERRVVAEPGSTLLEVIEGAGLRIESGCRMGMCGADPVAILSGAENLSAPTEDERVTLRRLGLAENARMACCARVDGAVSLSLAPERAAAGAAGAPELEPDPEVGRVVVVGNGIAGVTAADHVRRLHPDCEIHVVAREQHHLYNRMALTRVVYGRTAMQGLFLLPDEWYDQHRINCWLNTEAIAIDAEARRVVLGTGETLEYDRLILATGSRSFVPPIDGFGMPGTLPLREASDALAIRSFAQQHRCREAVVAGGGLLGLEAAYALLKLGLRVTILERGDWLLRRQIDPRAGELLDGYLKGLGAQVLHRSEAASLEGDGRVRRVRLRDGRALPCELFLACLGIAPNVELARMAGLAVNRGVVVDAGMRTSAPGIFAAGDVAEVDGQLHGLWPAAVEQAEVAAVNAVGGQRVHKGSVPTTILKVVGIDLTSIGQIEPSSADGIVIALEDPTQHRRRKLVIEDGTVVGAVLLGYPLDAPAVIAAVKQRVDVRAHLGRLEAGDWAVLGELTGVNAKAARSAVA
jgi:nitrite reductase (NADH) large subunit